MPLKIMYPDAGIPCVQLSLVNTLDPARHLEMGRALGGLFERNVLVSGSGFSFHNLRAFFAPVTDETRELNRSFEAWLADTCCSEELSEEERADRLIRWAGAPGARYCHPREDHLIPLHVCCGAAQGPCTERFDLTIMNRRSSMYLWEAGD